MGTYETDVIEPGDALSKLWAQVRRESWGNSSARVVTTASDHFRARTTAVWAPHILQGMMDGSIVEVASADGAGTKPGIYSITFDPKCFEGLAWEVITMNADDIACDGGLPVEMLSIVDIQQLTRENYQFAEAVVRGTGEALKKAGIILLTGETAIMRPSITCAFEIPSKSQLILNWGATMRGLARGAPDSFEIEPGMSIIALSEEGFRCNGGTRLTQLIQRLGNDGLLGVLQNDRALDFARRCASPSRSFARYLTHMNGWDHETCLPKRPRARFHALNITGGGLIGRLPMHLPDGVGAVLDALPEPPEVLRLAQRYSEVPGNGPLITDRQCYSTFNGGCSVIMVTPPKHVPTLLGVADEFGHKAQVIGSTTRGDTVTIKSRFMDGEIIEVPTR